MGNPDTTEFTVGFLPLRLTISRQFKIGPFFLACVLCVVAFSQSGVAEAPVETVEQLRQRYQQARATFARTKDYGKAYRESKESAHKLMTALLNHWMALPEGSTEEPAVCREIKTVYKDMAGNPLTEKYNKAKSFLAQALWPILAADEPTREQAALMVELTRPSMGVRMNDRRARSGKPTEPLGWDVQAAYALALIRSGKDKQAHDEVTILRDKIAINHARNPSGRLVYGPEAGEGRYRHYTDYLQLCEVLHALQAAISNDREGAKLHIEKAGKQREGLSPEAALLVTEVTRRISVDKD